MAELGADRYDYSKLVDPKSGEFVLPPLLWRVTATCFEEMIE